MDIDEIYAKGISFDEFIKKGNKEEKDKIDFYLEKVFLNEEIRKKIKEIDKKINILVMGEMWCLDCTINIPILKVINDINKNIDFRIIPREGNEENFKNYEKEGVLKIPTFIIMDEKFNSLGSIIERPSYLQNINDLNDQVERIKASKLYRDGELIIEMLNEILNIIEK